METTVFQIKRKDGSKFNVFCANKNQKQRVMMYYNKHKNEFTSIHDIVNGLHTVNQFKEINDNYGGRSERSVNK